MHVCACVDLGACVRSLQGCSGELVTPHAQRERGKVICVGVHIMFVDQNIFLNRTLAITSPFKTFALGLLVEFVD